MKKIHSNRNPIHCGAENCTIQSLTNKFLPQEQNPNNPQPKPEG